MLIGAIEDNLAGEPSSQAVLIRDDMSSILLRRPDVPDLQRAELPARCERVQAGRGAVEQRPGIANLSAAVERAPPAGAQPSIVQGASAIPVAL